MKATEQEFLEALIKHSGLYSRVAKELDVSRQAVRDRVESNPHIKELVEELTEVNLDEAEGELQKIISGKKINIGVKFSAIKFFLSTKGKKRGYVEKTEVEHSGYIAPAKVLTDEELSKIAASTPK